jgi:hypothetical protein
MRQKQKLELVTICLLLKRLAELLIKTSTEWLAVHLCHFPEQWTIHSDYNGTVFSGLPYSQAFPEGKNGLFSFFFLTVLALDSGL